MTPIHACLFDLDGTLIDSAEDITQSVNHVRTLHQLSPLSLADVSNCIGDGLTTLLERVLNTSDQRILSKATEAYIPHYFDHCLDQTTLYPGVLDMLRKLTVLKIPMAVVSNKPERFCRKILEGLSLSHLFGAVLGGDSTPQRKPQPQPFWKACNILKVAPPSALVIGDSTNDILGALNAGCPSCGVLWGIGNPRILRESKPNWLIEHPAQLPAIIES